MDTTWHFWIWIAKFTHWSILIEVYLAWSYFEIISVLSCVVENLTFLFNSWYLLRQRLLKIGRLSKKVRLVIRLLWTSLKSVTLIIIQKLVSQIALSGLLILTYSTILLKILIVKAFTQFTCRRRIILLLKHFPLILSCFSDDSVDLVHSIRSFNRLLSTWW